MHTGAAQGANAARSVASVMRAQVQAARGELHHHADVNMLELLAADFARERESIAAFAGRVQDRTREQLIQLQIDYPNLSSLIVNTSQRIRPESLQRWAHSAQVLAGHVAQTGFAVAGVAADAAGHAASTVASSELGQAILQLGHQVWQSFEVQVTMGSEAMRDAAQQGTFGAMAVAGGLAVAGLLAGERFVRNHEQSIGTHLKRANDAHGKVLGATHAALQTIGRSASRGALELGRVLTNTLHALDAAVGRRLGT
jgi:hypothetical protein